MKYSLTSGPNVVGIASTKWPTAIPPVSFVFSRTEIMSVVFADSTNGWPPEVFRFDPGPPVGVDVPETGFFDGFDPAVDRFLATIHNYE
jgi:hypothetical protein